MQSLWSMAVVLLRWIFEVAVCAITILWLTLQLLGSILYLLYSLFKSVLTGFCSLAFQALQELLSLPKLLLGFIFASVDSALTSAGDWLRHKVFELEEWWTDLTKDGPKKEPQEILREMGVGRRSLAGKTKTRQKTQSKTRKTSTGKEEGSPETENRVRNSPDVKRKQQQQQQQLQTKEN